MDYQYIDKGMMPPDFQEYDFDGEKTLKWVSETFTCQQVYGEDVFEKPSIQFHRWTFIHKWYMVDMNIWRNWDYPAYETNDEGIYQEYLKSNQ